MSSSASTPAENTATGFDTQNRNLNSRGGRGSRGGGGGGGGAWRGNRGFRGWQTGRGRGRETSGYRAGQAGAKRYDEGEHRNPHNEGSSNFDQALENENMITVTDGHDNKDSRSAGDDDDDKNVVDDGRFGVEGAASSENRELIGGTDTDFGRGYYKHSYVEDPWATLEKKLQMNLKRKFNG